MGYPAELVESQDGLTLNQLLAFRAMYQQCYADNVVGATLRIEVTDTRGDRRPVLCEPDGATPVKRCGRVSTSLRHRNAELRASVTSAAERPRNSGGKHVMVIAWEDLDVEGSIDPRTVHAAIEVVSRSNPENDWVGKMRDYALLGIPVYVVFDPRTGTGAVFTDIHATPDGPRYATRKDFVYGEDVTIGEWTIPTDGLPRYRDEESGQDSVSG